MREFVCANRKETDPAPQHIINQLEELGIIEPSPEATAAYEILAGRGISISMDGRGRAHDNIFVERLWRSVKYEDIFLKGYCSVAEARAGLEKYFEFYNNRRYHQALEYRTPAQEYFGTEAGNSRNVEVGRFSATENYTLGWA